MIPVSSNPDNVTPAPDTQIVPAAKVIASDNKPKGSDLFVINCLSLQGNIVFNTFWLFIVVSTYIINIINERNPPKSAAFLTNIAMLVTIVYLTLSNFYISGGLNTKSCVYKWMRVFYILAMSVELTVFLFYWPVIAPTSIPNYDKNCESALWCYLYTSVSHGLVVIPAWTLVLTGWTNLKPLEFLYPVIFVVVYGGAILIPFTLTVDVLYSILTFDDVLSFVLLLAIIVLISICYFIGYGISYCRGKKFQKKFGFKIGEEGKI